MRLDSGVALPGEEKGQEHLTSMFAPGILYQQGVEARERATVANGTANSISPAVGLSLQVASI